MKTTRLCCAYLQEAWINAVFCSSISSFLRVVEAQSFISFMPPSHFHFSKHLAPRQPQAPRSLRNQHSTLPMQHTLTDYITCFENKKPFCFDCFLFEWMPNPFSGIARQNVVISFCKGFNTISEQAFFNSLPSFCPSRGSKVTSYWYRPRSFAFRIFFGSDFFCEFLSDCEFSSYFYKRRFFCEFLTEFYLNHSCLVALL